MHIDDAHKGQIVTVKGYGGFAKILSIEPSPLPNAYIATVGFGPNNTTSGRVKYHDIEEFPLGRLEPAITNSKASSKASKTVEFQTAEDIYAYLAEIGKDLTWLTEGASSAQ